MAIQWFPGHMVSARKKAAENMAHTDLVIEVLDARIPEASTNPLVAQLRSVRQRPCIKLLNKADLADADVTRQWLSYYQAQPNTKALSVSCKTPADIARLPAMFRALAPHRNEASKPLRLMIMGIPNVGKSTLMNALLKRRIARVGDEPAVTKSQQTLEIAANMTVTDTPGLMWPKINYDADGFMLAACHAIGRNAVIDEEVAQVLSEQLLQRYPQALQQRYRINTCGMDGAAVVDAVGRRRGCLQKGGRLDYDKAARIILEDFRTGLLGRLSLETPQTRAQMVQNATPSDN